jgi:hypothetical protein
MQLPGQEQFCFTQKKINIFIYYCHALFDCYFFFKFKNQKLITKDIFLKISGYYVKMLASNALLCSLTKCFSIKKKDNAMNISLYTLLLKIYNSNNNHTDSFAI